MDLNLEELYLKRCPDNKEKHVKILIKIKLICYFTKKLSYISSLLWNDR